MKIIDLLNRIANGEEVPKEIKYNACLFAFKRQAQDYYCEEYGNLFEYLINEYITGEFLNYEIEIIEEDNKIEKISNDFYQHSNDYLYNELEKKINEIIDFINKGE